ncbi:unnamed protein product [Cylicocyclus nassatus]|uniref:GP-PDE domain-containing protein n=1 Tax=Cylicocyclus nassatus TaxID=53992 RepID=A0AA36M3U1_CYLNA|nr:unnamed protein product [Cylicocyclus nassatus]
MVCLCLLVILISALLACGIAAAILYKNKPCDPEDVRKFFEGFRICGHRGAPTSFPENGMAGFNQAKTDGADSIEFDIALTKDGEAVLLHDDLDRTTNLTGPIREKILAELARANISAHFTRSTRANLPPVKQEGIPKLETVVKWAVENKMKMIFDVKDSDRELVKIIDELFKKYQLYDKAIVCSFFPWVLYLVKQANHKILSGLTWRRRLLSYKDAENTVPRYSGPKHYLFVLLDKIYVCLLQSVIPWFLGADLLLTSHLEISKTFVREQHNRGRHVVAWTINDIAEMHWMVDELQIPILTDYSSYVKIMDLLKKIREKGYNEQALRAAVSAAVPS